MKSKKNNTISLSLLPKLPRFIVPKSMASKAYLDKKHKAMSRAKLNRSVDFY